MNKNLKTVLLIVLVIGVLLVAAFATGKKSVESITMEDYSKISKESGFVYYGKSSDMDTLKDLANDAVNWLENDLLPKINIWNKDAGSPTEWSTLYYMALAYANSTKNNIKSLYIMNDNELEFYCKMVIKWLRNNIEKIS